MNRLADFCDAVFGEKNKGCVARAEIVDQFSAHRIQFRQIGHDPRIIRPVFLQAIIQMRKIDQRKGRVVALIHFDRRIGDPLCRLDRRCRSPEIEQWELPELLLQFRPEARRVGPDVWQLQTACRVHRPWGDGVIGGRIHRVPPADVGAGECGIPRPGDVPELRLPNQRVGLFPEFDFAFVAKVPPVADDAVIGRPCAGEVGGLNGGRDGG